MKSRRTQHVVPNPKSGWDVKKGGASKSTKRFRRKSDAVDFARGVSRNQKAELVIHGKDGKIQRTDSYGNDPYPPKDAR